MSDPIKPLVGHDVHYYAEGNAPEEPYSGPYAAKVVSLHPEVAGEPPKADLVVWFSPEKTHAKYSVSQSAEPTKHHWCFPTSS